MSKLNFSATGIGGAGASVCSLAEELSAVRRKWQKSIIETHGDAFGLAEVEQAFNGVRDTWSQELGVYITILDQLCGKLRASGENHGKGEQANLTNVHGVRP